MRVNIRATRYEKKTYIKYDQYLQGSSWLGNPTENWLYKIKQAKENIKAIKWWNKKETARLIRLWNTGNKWYRMGNNSSPHRPWRTCHRDFKTQWKPIRSFMSSAFKCQEAFKMIEYRQQVRKSKIDKTEEVGERNQEKEGTTLLILGTKHWPTIQI